MRWLKTLLWMAAFFFVIHFSIQNREEITLGYAIQNHQLFALPKVPLFLMILCSVFLAVLIGGMSDLYKLIQLKQALRQSQRTVERLEKEIQSLRRPGLDQTSFLRKDP